MVECELGMIWKGAVMKSIIAALDQWDWGNLQDISITIATLRTGNRD
jgi:hypothetical protein